MVDRKLIDSIINEEIIDTELYLREAFVFKEKIIGGDRISDKFKKFAGDERNHLRALKIIFNIENIEKPRILPEYKRIRNVLRLHLIREKESINLYKGILSKLTELKHREIISEIINNELEHYNNIKNYLLKLT